MPIASVKSASEVPSYPLRQNTASARSNARSTSNSRGRPFGMATLLPFCTYRYIKPLDPECPCRYYIPCGTKSREGSEGSQELRNVSKTHGEGCGGHGGVEGYRRGHRP